MFQFEAVQFSAISKTDRHQSTHLLRPNGPSRIRSIRTANTGNRNVDYQNGPYSNQSSSSSSSSPSPPQSNSSPTTTTPITTTFEQAVDDHDSKNSESSSTINSQRNPFIGRSLCVVCKDKARGCNFGSITCASCKEFFRRNAFKFNKLKCYFQSKCEINVYSRRFCAACRLLKCYQMGMKNEYIMSDAEKYERQLKIIERKLVTKNGSGKGVRGVGGTSNHISSCLLSPTSIHDESTKEFSDYSESNNSNNNNNNDNHKNGTTNSETMDDFEEEELKSNDHSDLLKFDSNSNSNNNKHTLDANTTYLVPNIKKENEDSFEVNKIELPYDNFTQHQNPSYLGPVSNNHNNGRYSLFDLNQSINPNPSLAFQFTANNGNQLFGSTTENSSTGGNILKTDPVFFDLAEFNFDDNLFGETTIQSTPSSLSPYPESNGNDSHGIGDHHGHSNNYYYFDSKQQTNVGGQLAQQQPPPQQFSEIKRTKSFNNGWANWDQVDESETVRKLLCKVKIIRESSFYPTKFRLLLQARGMGKSLPHYESCKLKYLTSIVLIFQAETIHELPTNHKFIDLIRIAEIVTFNFIKMCKKMATFQALSQEDQVALVKGSVMETLIVWSVMTINLEKECWEALDLERNIKFSLKLELLKDANYKLYEKHLMYALSFEPEWRFNDNLMSLLIAIVLFNPNRPEISNVNAVRNAQMGYCKLLRSYLGTLYADSMVDEVYNRLLNQLNLTETISEYHVKAYFDVNANDISKNGIGGLIMEILDLND